jgi:GTP-binding protein EngB required for normal cell division
LLAAHVVCAGGLVHIQAQVRFERVVGTSSLSQDVQQEIERVLALDPKRVSVEELADAVDSKRREQAFGVLVNLAAIDSYLDYDEIALLKRISDTWRVPIEPLTRKQAEVDAALHTNQAAARARLSWRARAIGSLRRMFKRETVEKLVARSAPPRWKELIDKAWLEYLLGAEYADVVEECVGRAREDFPFTIATMTAARNVLLGLENHLDAILAKLRHEAEPAAAHTAQAILARATQTHEEVRVRLANHANVIESSLGRKQRSLDRVTIAFLGRTKAGKSTLHSILSKNGLHGIGSGAQRATRTNRTYEWERLRIVDTPGFGAATAPEDAEIAKAVLPESDLICFVVTADGQQQADFEVLTTVRALAKPLIIIVNFKSKLRIHEYREMELTREGGLIPDNVFREHAHRIRTFALTAYKSDNFAIVPVHLLAAQLSMEDPEAADAAELWRQSRMTNLLEKIRIAIVDDGPIRRSQTLLGTLPGEFLPSIHWAITNSQEYGHSAELLRAQGEADIKRLETAAEDAQSKLRSSLSSLISRLYSAAPAFAEDNWSASEAGLNWAWKQKVESLHVDEEIRRIVKKVDREYTESIVSIVEDSATELKLAQSLSGVPAHLMAQDANIAWRTVLKIAGIVMNVAGAILQLFHPVVGLILRLCSIVVNRFTSLFETESQKRAKAAAAIASSLRSQIVEYHIKTERALIDEFKTGSDAVNRRYRDYCARLLEAELDVSRLFSDTVNGLEAVSNRATRLFAKRIWDWARAKREKLTEASAAKTIVAVEREFGISLKIIVKKLAPLERDDAHLSRMLQERVSIEGSRRRFWG